MSFSRPQTLAGYENDPAKAKLAPRGHLSKIEVIGDEQAAFALSDNSHFDIGRAPQVLDDVVDIMASIAKRRRENLRATLIEEQAGHCHRFASAL